MKPAGLRAVAITALGLGLSCLGCSGEDAETRSRRAEASVLARESEQLRRLIEAVDEDTLVSPDWVAIGVEEGAVQSILEGGLNQEWMVQGRYRVVLRRAQVSFRNGYARITLEARVSDTRRLGVGAVVVVVGALEDPVLNDQGRLETRVLIDHIEVPRATALTSVVDRAAGRHLDAVQAQMPVLSIPVKLERSLTVAGRGEGVVGLQPGELPVGAKVARVLPVDGRLWVFLDVSLGAWRPREATAGGVSPRSAATAPDPVSPAALCPPRPVASGPAPAPAVEAPGPAAAPASVSAPLGDAPTPHAIAALHEEREGLRRALTDKIPTKMPAGPLMELRNPPPAGVAIGVPTRIAEDILSLAVTGPLAETRVLVEDLETRLEGEVANPVPFASPLGRYTVDLRVKRAEAVVRPGPPQWRFGADTIGFRLPVTLARAHGSAHVRLRFEGASRVGRLCGAVDVATDIETGLAPATHDLAGSVQLAVADEQLVARPRLEARSFHVALQPTEETWRALGTVVADVRRSTNRACAAALGGLDVEGIVRRVIERGFDLPVPAEAMGEVVLPAHLEHVVCAGERPLRMGARPESVRITPGMLWYGKAVSLEIVRVVP